MDKKDELREKSGREEESSLPMSFKGKNAESGATDHAPESYYHDITTPPAEGEDRYYEIFEKTKHKTRGWSVTSMVLGIISVLCCYFGWAGLVLGIAAIAFSVVSRITLRYFDGMSIAGLILGIFGVVFGGSMIVMEILIAGGAFDGYLKNLPI